MPERPLLILPVPGEPALRRNKPSGRGRPRIPARERQEERLEPRFNILQHAFDAKLAHLRAEVAGLVPEEVIVFEIVGSVSDFIVAVRNVEGLEWLGEIEEEDIPPDDDFFIPGSDGITRTDKHLRGRLFLVLTNNRALRQMLSLWELWKSEERLPRGLRKWEELFSRLRDVRLWGVRDRLVETGILDDWYRRVEHEEEIIPCEIELWFRGDHHRRRNSRDQVVALVQSVEGTVIDEATIEEIGYHALLVNLPIGFIRIILEEAGEEISLIQCEQIQFFRAAGQVVEITVDDARTIDREEVGTLPTMAGEPVVALFDGLPLQQHRRLAGRIVVDDPDNFEADYQAAERYHGTAMASLIIHGDLNAGESPLNRPLYIRPILRPSQQEWEGRTRPERAPEDIIFVDLIHQAVRRLFEGDGDQPAVAPQICAINLSIGIKDRLFESSMSPLAKLLDWLAWRYQVLFIVSAGNHPHSIECAFLRDQLHELTAEELQEHVIRAVASDMRNRRLLSPAEAINALTIGAIHQDNSTDIQVQRAIDPYTNDSLPSVINAQGMGYRRSIKPEIFLPGGKAILQENPSQGVNARFDVYRGSMPPGQLVAAPGPTPGDVSYSKCTRGTSNAAALASRIASQLYDLLEELRQNPGGEVIEAVPYAVWLKTLLVHGASWGITAEVLKDILYNPQNRRQFREYITRLIGYGILDPARISECTEHRVTGLGGGLLQKDQAHIHRFPLPPTLSGQHCWRCLVLTLAWLTPINMLHQAWRRADLWFEPPGSMLLVERNQADGRAVKRGTVQHEILEGDRAAAFVDGDNLEIQVNCRSDAGALEDVIPYALAVTLEIAEDIEIDIYDEVSIRIRAAQVRVAATE
jgi:hypothetical protein